jgi:molybdenum cofactor biosynthesis protein MoaC
MVNVGGKAETVRMARASSRVILGSLAFQAVESNSLAKGDVLSVARVAGILAAKQTANLIPLCHSLALDR